MNHRFLPALFIFSLLLAVSFVLANDFVGAQINTTENGATDNGNNALIANNNATTDVLSNTSGLIQNSSGMMDDTFDQLKDSFGSFFGK